VKISRWVKPQHKLALKIAGITVRIDSSTAFERFNDFGFYKDFIVRNGCAYHCRLEHRIGSPGKLPLDKGAFSTENWQLAKAGTKNVLFVGPVPRKGGSDMAVVFDRDYGAGKIYQKSVNELFRRFVDQFLIINLLSQNKGFLLHSSGVIWKGRGLCFAGLSGTGKSTLLDLFKDEVSRECLLNDDRCALRNYGDKWRVFGTPWYGESRVSSSAGADLSALFLIRHAKQNYLRKLSVSEIFPQLMVLSLLPLWDEQAASAVLATFKKLLENIPVYELGFLPDKRVISLIKKTV
jgi:hypothetical protein